MHCPFHAGHRVLPGASQPLLSHQLDRSVVIGRIRQEQAFDGIPAQRAHDGELVIVHRLTCPEEGRYLAVHAEHLAAHRACKPAERRDDARRVDGEAYLADRAVELVDGADPRPRAQRAVRHLVCVHRGGYAELHCGQDHAADRCEAACYPRGRGAFAIEDEAAVGVHVVMTRVCRVYIESSEVGEVAGTVSDQVGALLCALVVRGCGHPHAGKDGVVEHRTVGPSPAGAEDQPVAHVTPAVAGQVTRAGQNIAIGSSPSLPEKQPVAHVAPAVAGQVARAGGRGRRRAVRHHEVDSSTAGRQVACDDRLADHPACGIDAAERGGDRSGGEPVIRDKVLGAHAEQPDDPGNDLGGVCPVVDVTEGEPVIQRAGILPGPAVVPHVVRRQVEAFSGLLDEVSAGWDTFVRPGVLKPGARHGVDQYTGVHHLRLHHVYDRVVPHNSAHARVLHTSNAGPAGLSYGMPRTVVPHEAQDPVDVALRMSEEIGRAEVRIVPVIGECGARLAARLPVQPSDRHPLCLGGAILDDILHCAAHNGERRSLHGAGTDIPPLQDRGGGCRSSRNIGELPALCRVVAWVTGCGAEFENTLDRSAHQDRRLVGALYPHIQQIWVGLVKSRALDHRGVCMGYPCADYGKNRQHKRDHR